jgi:uncharacterized membrane protein
MQTPPAHPILTSMPWLLHPVGRTFAALAAGGAGALAFGSLPGTLQVIGVFDVMALTYVILFLVMTIVITPDQAAEFARHREPSGTLVLILTVFLSLISIAVIPALQGSLADRNVWIKVSHVAASLLALFLCWILVHIFFSLQYMSVFYDEPAPPSETALPHLDFPARPVPDFWDFMYFAFTIAMCYQTSDVTINGPAMRRLTLLHAIFSFFYVVLIIGLVVSILDNAI